jgi:Cu/Ag efflux protein CusF
MTNAHGKLWLWFLGALLALGAFAQAQAPRKRVKPRTAKAKPATPKPAPSTPEPATPSEGSLFNITPRRSEPAATPAPAKLKPVIYKLRGKVLEVHRQPLQATVEHEEIPGYMGAMTMKFPLKNTRLADTLKPGDLIEATLFVSQTNGDWWLDEVVVKKK